MRLIRAGAEEQNSLRSFFNQGLLPGILDLKQVRSGDFFALYKMQTDDFVTYLLVDAKEQIEAMATLLFRTGYVQGEKQTIGYATDLRVSSNRKAILGWSQHFLPVLEQERESRRCKYVFTVVPHGHRQAYNAFIRPRNVRRNLPRYYLFRHFEVIGLHGELPFAPDPLSGLTYRKARGADQEALFTYIAKKNRHRPINFASAADEVQKNFERWPNLKIEDFWMALTKQGEIVGCTAPWSSAGFQDLYAEDLGPRARAFSDTLSSLSWLGLTRKLFSGPERKLSPKFLSFLHANNPDVFHSLTQTLFRETSKRDFICYAQFENDHQRKPLRSQISSHLNYGLYCILAPYDELPDFLRLGFSGPPPELELPFL